MLQIGRCFLMMINIILLIGCVNGQEEIEIITEGELAVSPDTIVISINILSDEFIETELKGKLKFLTKKEVLENLKNIDGLKRIKKEKYFKEEINEHAFSTEYVEVYGKESYKTLVDKFKFKTPFFVEEIKLNNIEEYENNLVDTLIEKSRVIAKGKVVKKKNKEPKLIDYKEVIQEEIQENEPIENEESTGFQMLKEKFIEYGYKGYKLNSDGEIVIDKKLIVTWEIK